MAEEPAVAFVFSPVVAIPGLLDYTRSKHSKIYKTAITEVLCKEPFDCKAEGLYQFLMDVQESADQMGWSNSILNIMVEVDDKITQYRKSSIKTAEQSCSNR